MNDLEILWSVQRIKEDIIMYNWKRKIEVWEYESDVFPKQKGVNWSIKDSANDSYKTEHKDLEITFFQLLLSTAKSMITKSYKYSTQVALFARSYSEVIQLLLDDKDGYLAFNYDFRDILRDFSKVTRHGEIAQGINYFYAKERLGAYAVFDFKDYARRAGISKKCRGYTPDYVYCRSKDKAIGILESKGTMQATPTGFLIHGHDQCTNGEAYLKSHGIIPANSYVSAVSFGTTSPRMHRHTRIYIADPSNKFEYKDENPKENSLYEYSKLFYLAGNRRITEKLMWGETIQKSDFEFLESSFVNNGVIIGEWDVKDPFTNRMARINLGIKSSLADCLTGENDVLQEYEHRILENREEFSDGTFIVMED